MVAESGKQVIRRGGYERLAGFCTRRYKADRPLADGTGLLGQPAVWVKQDGFRAQALADPADLQTVTDL